MEMKMMMRIDVIERKPRCAKGLELRGYFSGDLPARGRWKQEPQPGHQQIVSEQPIGADEVANFAGRQRRTAIHQNEMQADAQRGQATRACDSIIRSGSADHQARRGQNAVRVRRLDGIVDLDGQAEVVGGDDQRFQCAVSRRSRRKRKNSTPSRSLRIIISGLLAISATIDAILPLRK